MSADPLAQLRGLYDAPASQLPDRAVAVLGATVPTELILACDFVPVRLSGRARLMPLAERYGLGALDPPTRAAFEQLMDSGGRIERALIGADLAAQNVAFQTLRELRRLDPAALLPSVVFVDLLHLPRRTSARYNRAQLARMLAVLADWSQTTPTTEGLEDGIARVNTTRRLLDDVMALRRRRPARLSGTEALAAAGAALVGVPDIVQPLLRKLAQRAPALRERNVTRVYMTGSTHEDAEVYEGLESRGCVIVGEDHRRGEEPFGPAIAGEGDPLERIALGYQQNPPPSRSSSVERARRMAVAARAADADVVVACLFAYDESSPWDIPEIRDAAAAVNLPLIVLRGSSAPELVASFEPSLAAQ